MILSKDAGNEIRLRRDISSSHDIYTLNNRQILTSQLLSTLQSAGLSKVNPYYIIKQGKVILSESSKLCLLIIKN